MTDELIIMAKNPFERCVKTRLARAVGTSAARGIYARLLYSALINLCRLPRRDVRITLSLASSSGAPFFKEAFPEFNLRFQCAGDIGVRMRDALDIAFRHNTQKAVLVGTDIPGINWEILDQAFQRINQDTVVLGPTSDLGYYLIGMMSPGVDVFDNIIWSTNTVLDATIKNIKTLGLDVVLLTELGDVDEEADLRQWQANLKINAKDRPH